MKKCTKCGEVKPLDQFGVRSMESDGLNRYCRTPCVQKISAEYRAKYASKIKESKSSPEALARQRELATTDNGRKKERERKRTPKARRYQRDWTLRSKFGITLDQYDGMFRAQGGACAICGHQNLNGKALDVDHNHATGKVRALLCNRCNQSLGLVKESIERLDGLKAYLLKWSQVPSEAM